MPRPSKLPDTTLLQLTRDFHFNPELLPEEIARLRPDMYIGDNNQFKAAVKNRYYWLKDQKLSFPTKYKELVEKATTIQRRATVEETSESEATSEEEVDEHVPPPPPPVRSPSAFASPPSSKKPKASFSSPPSNRQPSSRSTPRSTPRPTLSSTKNTPASAKRTTPSKASTPRSPSPTMSTKRGDRWARAHQAPLFESLDDAISKVDHECYVDFDMPEKLGHGLFAQRIEEGVMVTGPSGTVVNDKMKITIGRLEDLSDWHEMSGLLVLNGTALLFTKPSVPDFLRREYLQMYALEQNKCERTIKQHAYWVNAVEKDHTRKYTLILIVFPEGVVCTTDFVSLVPPTPHTDMKVKLELRQFQTTKNISKKKTNNVTQTHCPGTFNLRILGVDRDLEVHSEEDDDIDDAFMGQMSQMNVSSAKGTKGKEKDQATPGTKGKEKDQVMPDHNKSF